MSCESMTNQTIAHSSAPRSPLGGHYGLRLQSKDAGCNPRWPPLTARIYSIWVTRSGAIARYSRPTAIIAHDHATGSSAVCPTDAVVLMLRDTEHRSCVDWRERHEQSKSSGI